MMRLAIAMALLCAACSSAVERAPEPARDTIIPREGEEASGMQSPDERIGQRIEPLDVRIAAADPRYGTTPGSPVRVGGGAADGPIRTFGFLNALRGPEGQPVHYRREADDDSLVVYELTYDGAREPLRLYFDWTRAEELRIPVGLLGR